MTGLAAMGRDRFSASREPLAVLRRTDRREHRAAVAAPAGAVDRRFALRTLILSAAAGLSAIADGGGTAFAAQLERSGPVRVTESDQVIENLDIFGTPGGPAIMGIGRKRIRVRNCRIHQPVGCTGIHLQLCPEAVVEDCEFIAVDPPASGPLAAETTAVLVSQSPEVLLRRLLVTNCSAGIYIHRSPRVAVQQLVGHNQRGPLPRASLIQFDHSDRGLLEDFYVLNDLAVAQPEDIVSMWWSNDCFIRQGLIDGNNSRAGACVIFENSENGVCEDVDVVRFSNIAFSVYPGRHIVFRRCRARDSFRPTPRGEPESRSLLFAAGPLSADVRLIDCAYFAHVNPANILWDHAYFSDVDLREENFSLRQPLRLTRLPD